MKQIPGWASAIRAAILLCACVSAVRGQNANNTSAAFRAGDYGKAELGLRERIRLQGETPTLLNDLAITLELEGKSSEAVPLLRRSMKDAPSARSASLLADAYCRLREDDLAANVLRDSKQWWDDSEALATLAPCYLQAGTAADAINAYELLIQRKWPPLDDAFVGDTQALLRASREYGVRLKAAKDSQAYVEAIRKARRENKIEADDAVAAAVASSPYLRADMGLEDLLPLEAEHGADPAFLYLVTVRSGEDAIEAMDLCFENFADTPSVQRLHADVLAQTGHTDAALKEYTQLQASSPNYTNLIYNVALIQLQTGDWPAALASFHRLQSVSPADERAIVGIRESLVHLGKYDELLAQIKDIAHAPQAPEWAVLDWATAQQAKQNVTDAIDVLEHGKTSNPFSPRIHYRLASLYRLTKQPEKAAAELKAFQSASAGGK